MEKWLILFIFCGCAQVEVEKKDLLAEIEQLIDSGRYILALEKVEEIRAKNPYSLDASNVELLKADILFKQDQYAEAFGEYLLFYELHPKHSRIDYVLSQMVASLVEQLPRGYDRDISSCLEIISNSNRLIRSYPSSKYVANAKEYIKLCSDKLLAKEVYIADFYLRTKKYNSALLRYMGIVDNLENYPARIKDDLIKVAKLLKKDDICVKYGGKNC